MTKKKGLDFVVVVSLVMTIFSVIFTLAYFGVFISASSMDINKLSFFLLIAYLGVLFGYVISRLLRHR